MEGAALQHHLDSLRWQILLLRHRGPSSMRGIKGRCSTQGKHLFPGRQEHFWQTNVCLFLVFFIGLSCISPSNKIVIIHEPRCSYVPPLSLLFYVHKQVSHLTTKACFLFKWTYITMPTHRRGERINWLDAQVSYPAGVLTRSGHFCPTLGAFHPRKKADLEGIIYKRLKAVCLLSELTENSGLIIKINNGIQSNFPGQRSGRLSCNQSLEVNSQGIYQVKDLAPPCAEKLHTITSPMPHPYFQQDACGSVRWLKIDPLSHPPLGSQLFVNINSFF